MQQPTTSSSGMDTGARENRALANAFAPSSSALVDGARTLGIGFFGLWASVVEVFLRHSFGERYLGIFRLTFAGTILFLLWFIPALFSPVGVPGLLPLFFFGYVAMAILHRWRIWLRFQKSYDWHSMSFGISYLDRFNWPGLGVHREWALFRWWECVIGVVAGLIAIFILRELVIGFIVITSSICQLIKNNLIFDQFHDRILDLRDAQIEGQFYHRAAFDKPTAERAGIPVIQADWLDTVEEFGNLEDTLTATMGSSSTAPAPDPDDDMDLEATLNETLSGDDTPTPLDE